MAIEIGNYQHYKGGLYAVMTTGRLEKTKEIYIVYRSLQDNDDYPKDTVWIRPMVEFEEMVAFEGKNVPRFTFLGAHKQPQQ